MILQIKGKKKGRFTLYKVHGEGKRKRAKKKNNDKFLWDWKTKLSV